MGDDFSTHQVFVGSGDALAIRNRIIAAIGDYFEKLGFRRIPKETETSRSLVVGLPSRWISIGDKAGSTQWQDWEAFCEFSATVSDVAPVVDISMDDSCAIKLCLYRDGRLVDQFANQAHSIFSDFSSPDEAAFFAGQPELWFDFLLDAKDITLLGEVWMQGGSAETILNWTKHLLGFDNDVEGSGYTYDADGVPYGGNWDDERIEGIDVLHFLKDGS